jgi:hypothetical protein
MNFLPIARAALRRARLIREADGESGFMLIYVLMVTTMITVLVGTTLVATSGSIVPSVQSAYSRAAEQAAQAGLQKFLAYADTNCSNQSAAVAACTLPLLDSGVVSVADGAYSWSYHWTAVKGTRFFRVTSTGNVVRGGLTATKILVADVAGGVSGKMTDASYVTQLETQAPDISQQMFPPRTIALNSAAIASAKIPASGTSVTWSGGTSGATTAGSVNVCNSLYYGATGRVNNPAPDAATPYVDWSETGAVGTSSYTAYQPCQVSIGHSTKFLAPSSTTLGLGSVQSKDALLLSNSYPGGTGPVLNQPVYTGYKYDPSVDGPCGVTGQNYRTFNLACAGYPVDVGGTPAIGSYTPTFVSSLPSWPTTAPVVQTTSATVAGACWYNGPTRVRLNADGSATITSPQTTAVFGNSDLACYGGSTPTSSGLLGVTVANIATVSNGVIYAQNSGSAPSTTPTLHTNTGWSVVNTRAAVDSNNAVFYAKTPGSVTTAYTYVTTAADANYAPSPSGSDNPSSHADAAWTPQWTGDTTGTSCSSSTAFTDLKFYRCYANNGAYDATAYTDLKTSVKTALAASPSSYHDTAGLVSLVNSVVTKANSSDAGNATPTYSDYRSHRWVVTAVSDASATDGCTPVAIHTTGTSSATITAPLSDSLFENTAGTQTITSQNETTCLTATVKLQVGTCTLISLAVCVGQGWGDGSGLLGGGLSISQFKVTETVNTTTVTTTTTDATSKFPITGDVTPYGAGMTTAGPGDLYVEGTSATTLALVAQNDVVITNTLKPADVTNNALEVVARNDVRVYHPVSCKSTDSTAIAATTAGFCPNDITGLYSGVLATADRPDQQYTNLAGTALNNLTINAAIFALGNATSSCPQPSAGGGYCGGEFTADNYNRGSSLGTVTVVGGIYMAHHGPVGQEWEIADTTGQTSRPYSGYQLTDRYQNLGPAIAASANVAKVLATTTVTSSLWRIVSVSTGTS